MSLSNRINRALLPIACCAAVALVLPACKDTKGSNSAGTPSGSNAPAHTAGTAPANTTRPSTATNQRPATGRTSPYRATSPLYQAVIDADLAKVKAALDAGDDPNEFIEESTHGAYTAMHAAARLGNAAILRLLIERGGEVNVKAKAPHQATPLHWAARADRLEACVVLVEAGAEVNALANPHDSPQTPLKVAAERQFWDIVDYLRRQGGTE